MPRILHQNVLGYTNNPHWLPFWGSILFWELGVQYCTKWCHNTYKNHIPWYRLQRQERSREKDEGRTRWGAVGATEWPACGDGCISAVKPTLRRWHCSWGYEWQELLAVHGATGREPGKQCKAGSEVNRRHCEHWGKGQRKYHFSHRF